MKLIIANEFTDIKDDEVLASPLNGDDIFSLPNIARSECISIKCFLTDKIPLSSIGSVVNTYVSKLRHGAKILFSGTDINQVCLGVVNRQLDVVEANALLYGGPEPHNLNSGLYSINDISALLQGLGLRITKKAFSGLQYIVEAERE